MQGSVHSLNYLGLVTPPHPKPWQEPVGFPFQPPYKGRGAVLVLLTVLGLWALTGELDEAAQIGRASQAGEKVFSPVAGTETWTPDTCLWECPSPACGCLGCDMSGVFWAQYLVLKVNRGLQSCVTSVVFVKVSYILQPPL